MSGQHFDNLAAGVNRTRACARLTEAGGAASVVGGGATRVALRAQVCSATTGSAGVCGSLAQSLLAVFHYQLKVQRNLAAFLALRMSVHKTSQWNIELQ